MLTDAVRAARLNVAFAGHPTSISLALVLATLTLAVLWPTGNGVGLIGWYCVFLVISATRLSLFFTHRKSAATANSATLERLQRKLILACGAGGASWGLACVIAFPDAPLLKMFLSFVIAGVSAAAVASLSSVRAAALSFVVACSLPLAVRLLSSLQTVEIAMSVMVILFVVLIGVSASRLDAQLLALVRSRMEADEHLRARTAQREELQALNERLRLAVQAGKASIFEMDLTDNTITSDAQFYAMYDVDATLGPFRYEMWRQRVHPQDLARVEASFADLIEERRPFNEEFRVVWADGTERVIKSVALVQRDARDTPRRIVGMNSDITELKRVDRMKSEFVSIVSHELRTPLTSIRAALGLIAGGGAGDIAPKAHQLLLLANRNAERLGVLVDDMLDMERIESGKLRIDVALQSLQPILEQAIAVNSAYAAARKISLKLSANAAEAVVAVDANRLLQVMTNLLSNAVKFSPADGCVDIDLQTNHHRATIEVRDRGPGIPNEFQPKLFGKFCQSDSSDTRVQGGSGLGLAISKALVEQMAGRIYFTTGAAGTSFFVDLPLRSSDAVEYTTVVLPMAV